jgi:hypothetical protein
MSKDWKKDPFLSSIAKDILREKISGYTEKIKNDIKPTVEDIIDLTQSLAPETYKDIVDAFYEKEDKGSVNHPDHYGGEENPYEAIKIIEALSLDFHSGNALKYIIRAGKKDLTKEKEDLLKAIWYLNRRIENIEKGE